MSQAPRPRLVLHIGTHKTGTTSLQDALAGARERLLVQHGLLYPDTSRPPLPWLNKHGSVYHAAISQDPQVRALERETLLAEWRSAKARGAHTLLISEEGLAGPEKRIAAFFAPFAAEFDIEVLCYLRRQDLFVESLFNQFVRERQRREARHLLAFLRAPATQARLNYHAMLSVWAALPARLHVLDFDSQAVRGRGLVQSFESALQLPSLALPELRANPSPDMRLALLLSQMNRLEMDYALQPLMQAARTMAQDGMPARKHLLGAVLRQRVLADAQASNQRLAADFGLRFGDDLPSQEGPYPAEDVDSGYGLRLLSEVSRIAAAHPSQGKEMQIQVKAGDSGSGTD